MTVTNNSTVRGQLFVESATDDQIDIMMVLTIVIASVGMIANFTVVFVFSRHQKLRLKIPNIFIINQVSRFNCHRSIVAETERHILGLSKF